MRTFVVAIALSAASHLVAQMDSEAKRAFSVADALAIRDVSSPRVSPDGTSVVYVVSGLDLEDDVGYSNLYEVAFEGGEARTLTVGKRSHSHPRFSPDGRVLAFLSDRGGESTQIWTLDRRGGEPKELSSVEGGVADFEWSPDGKAIVFVSRDPDPEPEPTEEESATAPPLVITRLQFKRDGRGYLDDRRTHLYVLDLGSRKHRQITSGPYDDSQPAWSPDGREIAFVSNRTDEPDANDNSDIFLVPAGGGEPRQLTDNPGTDGSPAWSPDGKWIAYVANVEPDLIWYATSHLAVVPSDGGEPRVLTASLDRNVLQPSFAPDGDLYFLVEDSANQHLARTDIEKATFELERILSGDRAVGAHHTSKSGRTAVLSSEPHLPSEVFALHDGEMTQLSRTNEELLGSVSLSEVENIHFPSRDGTEVEGFVTKPANFDPTRRYPTVLWIHGGPVSQYSHAFNEIWQVWAGAGYVVVSANPRGSSGYGQDFSRAIWADWGNKDFEDVNAAVDYVIEQGYADPERLGVGGWSYGGILTNYVITKTDRFAAAISGASETNYIACYGTDHYQHEWEKELGLPWENQELYLKLSPLTYVANVVTPTLVLCGEHDWNVPLNQSEQLYQSLRRLGVDTMLIVYPGQSHGIRTPSYQKDRYERYLGWFDRFLLGEEAGEKTTPGS